MDATDILIARSNQTWSQTALKLIDLSGGKATGSKASIHDAVTAQTADRAWHSSGASPAKLTWLCEFEQPNPKERSSTAAGAVESAVDALLAIDSR